MAPSTKLRDSSSHTAHFSATACMRCREQKLKCSRERPACSRCCKFGTSSCIYPDPPNRRIPRSKRRSELVRIETQSGPSSLPGSEPRSGLSGTPPTVQTSGTRRAGRIKLSTPSSMRQPIQHSETPGSSNSHAKYISTPVFSNSYQNQLHVATPRTSPSIFSSSQPPPLPPTSLGLALLEIYFARIYNSSIIFHKPLLFHQYVEGKVDVTLLRALFALASIFIRSDDPNEELRALSAYHASGLPWAKAATREAMQLAMEAPTLAAAQTLQCVQIYWFCTGHSHPGKLCLSLAYRLCQLLGYSKALADDAAAADPVEAELGRRCFWSCWASTCVVLDAEPAWRNVAMLPLPGVISSTAQGYRILANQAMREDWHSVSLQPEAAASDRCSLTPSGSLIQVFGVWAKVQLLCQTPPASIRPAELASIHRLSDQAASLFNGAQAARRRTNQGDSTIEDENLHMLHDGIYHVCQIIMHSLLVPLLSEISADDSIGNHRQVQSRAAETVMQHVDAFTQLLTPNMQGPADLSRISPFLAYNAFIVAMVILTTEAARHSQTATETETPRPAGSETDMHGRLWAAEQIANLLSTLRVYWLTLEQPCDRLCSALQTYHSLLRNKPEHMEASIQPAHMPITDNSSLGTAQAELFPEFQWHSLSLADAGLEQLAEFELSSLFQQGWMSFS